MGSSWPQRSFEGFFTAVYPYEIRGGCAATVLQAKVEERLTAARPDKE